MSSIEKLYPHTFKNSPFGKKKVINYKKLINYSIIFAIGFFIFYSLKTKTSNIAKIEVEINKNKNYIALCKKREEDLNNKIKSIKKEVDKLKIENKDLNDKKTISKYEKEKLEKKGEINEREKIQEGINKKKIELNDINNKNNQFEKQYKQLNSEKENYLNEIGKLENQINEIQKKLNEKVKEKERKKEIELKYNSKIIENDREYNIFKNSYSNNQYNIELIYRLSRDGNSPSSFHNLLKDTKNTLILLLLKDGNKIGGYTSKSWNINGFQIDYYSYIFSIPKAKKYLVQNPNHSIYCTSNEFPSFGNGDLKIYSNKISSSFPVSYSINSKSLEFTDGKNSVELIEMEVFKIIN